MGMNYEMGGTILSKTVKEKDLGVTMNANSSKEQDEVAVIADDTHVLVLLVYSVHMQFEPILYGNETAQCQ